MAMAGTPKMKLNTWLKLNLDHKMIPELEWLPGSKTTFKMPWYDASNKSTWSEEKASIFKEYTISRGKYNVEEKYNPEWKSRLRNALKKAVENDRGIRLIQKDTKDSPFRIYEFYKDYKDKKQRVDIPNVDTQNISAVAHPGVPTFVSTYESGSSTESTTNSAAVLTGNSVAATETFTKTNHGVDDAQVGLPHVEAVSSRSSQPIRKALQGSELSGQTVETSNSIRSREFNMSGEPVIPALDNYSNSSQPMSTDSSCSSKLMSLDSAQDITPYLNSDELRMVNEDERQVWSPTELRQPQLTEEYNPNFQDVPGIIDGQNGAMNNPADISNMYTDQPAIIHSASGTVLYHPSQVTDQTIDVVGGASPTSNRGDIQNTAVWNDHQVSAHSHHQKLTFVNNTATVQSSDNEMMIELIYKQKTVKIQSVQNEYGCGIYPHSILESIQQRDPRILGADFQHMDTLYMPAWPDSDEQKDKKRATTILEKTYRGITVKCENGSIDVVRRCSTVINATSQTGGNKSNKICRFEGQESKERIFDFKTFEDLFREYRSSRGSRPRASVYLLFAQELPQNDLDEILIKVKVTSTKAKVLLDWSDSMKNKDDSSLMFSRFNDVDKLAENLHTLNIQM